MNKSVTEIVKEHPRTVCHYCNLSEVNALEWGAMYQHKGVTVHYFCMLFSAGLSQNGEDNEGILGFLPQDIRRELKRGDRLKCKFCRKPRATIGCSVTNCKASYHYPCGLQNGCQFKFIGNYESYCSKHNSKPDIPLPRNEWDCPICYSDVLPSDIPVWPPCCKKRVFHKKCILLMAKNHGLHFFKCPLCNDKDTFSVAMRNVGIYVPDRDAAWEIEPNAFADHARLHSRCDAAVCDCPDGRDYDSSSDSDPWKVVRCGTCGAFATHKHCGKLKSLTWRCPTCADIFSDKQKSEALNNSRIQRHYYDSSSDDEADEDLSVQNPIIPPSEVVKNSLPAASSGVDADSDSENDKNWVCFDPRYRTQFVVDVDEESESSESEEEEEEEVFISPESKLYKKLYGTTTKSEQKAKASASSETVAAKGKKSADKKTSFENIFSDQPSSSESMSPIPLMSLAPLGRDKLIKGDSRRTVKGHIELEETPEVISESDLKLVKITSNGVTMPVCNRQPGQNSSDRDSRRKNNGVFSSAKETCRRKADTNESSSGYASTDGISPLPKNFSSISDKPSCPNEDDDDVCWIEIKKPPVFEVEDSDSEVEIIDEKPAPCKKPAIQALFKKAMENCASTTASIISKSAPYPISSAFLKVITKSKNETYFSNFSDRCGKKTSKTPDQDISIIETDQGPTARATDVTKTKKQGEGRIEKTKRSTDTVEGAKGKTNKSKRLRTDVESNCFF